MIETWFSPGLWISELVVQRVGWTLVHSLWQLSLLALAARWAADLWGRRSASARHGILLAGISLMALAPVATWLAQETVSTMPPATRRTSTPASISGDSTNRDRDVRRSVGMTSATQPFEFGATSGMTRPRLAGDEVTDHSLPVWRQWQSAGERFLDAKMRWVVAFWCWGVLLFAARPAIGWWSLRCLRTHDLASAPSPARVALDRAANRLASRIRVEMYESSRVRIPIVIGYLRPLILLPASITTSLTPMQLEAILLHELAHIQRHDFLTNVFQTIVETVFFYHPAVWWISRQLRLEREHCCDDLAASVCGNRVEYGRALLILDEWRCADSVLVLGAGGGPLLRRVERLFDSSSHATRQQPSSLLASCLFAAIAVVCSAWVIQPNSLNSSALAAPAATMRVATLAASDSWTQWGGSPARNNVSQVMGLPAQWPELARSVRWSAPLGTQTYGSPVIASGKVLIGTNNGAARDPQHPATVDRSCLQCFDEATGEFLWQYASEKLPAGRVHDWPGIGLCSTPCVVGERVWIVTNRCELLCLDLNGFRDNENDGPHTDEIQSTPESADVVWRLDMLNSVGATPHQQSCSSPTVAGGLVLLNTGFSPWGEAGDAGQPRGGNAPSFLAVDMATGKVVWSHATPPELLLPHECLSCSPSVAVINGVTQAIFAAGDGWVYSFDFEKLRTGKSELLWKFDGNPKTARYALGGAGRRNSILAPPVVEGHRVFVIMGQNPEHGEGEGDLWCIDATRRGDLSSELVYHESAPQVLVPPRRKIACDREAGEFTRPNPQSGVVWHFQGLDVPANGKRDFVKTMHRALAAPVIHGGLVYAVDTAGILFCLDAATGKPFWSDDLLSSVWSTPLIADDKLFVATEQGEVRVYRLGRQRDLLATNSHGEALFSTPAAANSTLFLASRSHLSAIVANAAAKAQDARQDGQPTAAVKETQIEDGKAQDAKASDNKAQDVKVKVREAMLKGAEYLRSKQEEDGAWRLSNPSEMLDPGLTALSLVAMLRAGEPVDSQTAQRAFALLAKAQPNSSYSISLRVIATCHLQAFDRQAVERDVAWLVAAQLRNGPSKGGWTYTSAPNRADGSCTRFALWALDTAHGCGVSVPEETWRLAAEFWLSSQSPQGGWSYIPGQGNATPSMTLAGIAGLESVRGAVADAALHLQIDAAVAKAWKFLEPLAPAADQWLSPQANSPMYRLHALSIAGRMSQQEKIAQLDWETKGIELLLSMQKPGTGEWESSGGESAIVSTAFALLFLRPTESSHRKPSP